MLGVVSSNKPVRMPFQEILGKWRSSAPRRGRHMHRSASEWSARAAVIDLGSAGLGPSWDHTLCAMLHDLRVHERHASGRWGENRQRAGEMRYRYFLGVKWSQFQILSARHSSEAVSGVRKPPFLRGTRLVVQPLWGRWR